MAHWSDSMYRSGMQEARYQANLQHRREQAQRRRDKALLLRIMEGDTQYVARPSTALRRLEAEGFLSITEQLFPENKRKPWRIELGPDYTAPISTSARPRLLEL